MQHGQPYTTRRAVAGGAFALVAVLGVVALNSDDGGLPVEVGAGPSTSTTRHVTTTSSSVTSTSLAITSTTAARSTTAAASRKVTTTTKPRPKATTTTTRRPAVQPAPTSTSTSTTLPSGEPPSPTGNCHPSYGPPCLEPNIGDWDCTGGDGPNITSGPVFVHGPDEYDLDPDHNGVGCEEG